MKLIKKLTLVLVLLLVPTIVNAKTYNYTDLEQTLKEEGIEASFENYKETDDQITIYLFRGKGCGYCKKFLTFLNSITDEYGKYFKLRSYEVWYDEDNYDLLKDVAEFLDEDAEGVPFIVIGDTVFPGYAAEYDEKIKQAIVDTYTSEENYDVLVELEKSKQEKELNIKPLIIWSAIGSISTVLATSCLIAMFIQMKKKDEQVINSLELINFELKKLKLKEETKIENKKKK